MTTAYLLAIFRLDGDVPVFVRTEINFDPDPMYTGLVSMLVLQADGGTFEAATEEAIAMAEMMTGEDGKPRFEWAVRSLVKR